MTTGWASSLKPYLERAPLAALALGVSSGFTFAMIGATLTTRLAQHGVNKSAVTGRFVSKRTVKSSPKTTYKQTVKKK